MILDEEQVRPPGEFNALAMARELWKLIERLLVNFAGIRLVREAPWARESALPVNQLCQMEATGSILFDDTDVRALCLYDLNRHTPAVIHTALRTHPLVILEGRGHSNPYYDVPRILENEPHLFNSEADGATVATMLMRLRTLS